MLGHVRRVGHSRDAEVEQLQAERVFVDGRDEQVCGLHVAVDVAAAVLERQQRLRRGRPGLLERQGVGHHEAVQGHARQALHHEVELGALGPIDLAVVMHGHDVRVRHLGGDDRATTEATRVLFVASAQQLHGDAALELDLLGLPDHAHGAAADGATKAVATREELLGPIVQNLRAVLGTGVRIGLGPAATGAQIPRPAGRIRGASRNTRGTIGALVRLGK